ncbi:hypothetical protein [Acetobacter syzygii]|uniref:hypothetical protein n=1 Tax=Acetobacter syzygii TaxID=146476 RepID=UPI0015C9D048|nr:hypothetical protein [Acetobacter syzygii]
MDAHMRPNPWGKPAMTRSFYGPTPAKSLRLTSPQRTRMDRTLPRAGVKPPKV